jgi:hypothetical protein
VEKAGYCGVYLSSQLLCEKPKYEDYDPGQTDLEGGPMSKITTAKKAEGITQAVECLPSSAKALSSNLNTDKKNVKSWAQWFVLEITSTQEFEGGLFAGIHR